MANDFGDALNYLNKKEYLWNVLSGEKKTNVSSAFHDLIEYYINGELSPQLKEAIFGDNRNANSFEITDKELAWKLSFFLMQELNLFAVVEFAKLAEAIVKWLLKRDNKLTEDEIWLMNSPHEPEHSKVNHIAKSKKLKQKIKFITGFLHNKLDNLHLIGRRQVRYVFYLANEDRKVFKQKPSPMIFRPISINKYKLDPDHELSLMDNNMYGSKNLVESFLIKRSLVYVEDEIDTYLDPEV